MSVRTDSSSPVKFNPRFAIPILLFLFVFCLVIDQGFKFMTKPMADDLGLDITTASLQVTLTGIVLAVGIVIYSTLADVMSMRKLLYISIGLIALGSLVGFVFQGSWPLVLTGRMIQTAGIAAAETLYVIYATKYFTGNEQKKYLGYSTAAFQFAGLVGVLASGVVATYLHWSVMFLLPVIALATLPFLKRLPNKVDEATEESGGLDLLGLFLIAVIATGVILFIQAFNWLWLVPAVVAIAVFVWHIRTHGNAIVDPAFFKNGRFITTLGVVFIMYTVYMGYVFFVFPVAIPELHGMDPVSVAFLMVPGYLCGALVGVFSGGIAKYLSSKQAIVLAISLSILALAMSALFIESTLWVLILGLAIYVSCDSLMYAPLISTAVQDIPPARNGVAIGFYNLVINIAFPVGAAYTAKLLEVKPDFLGFATVGGTGAGAGYATVLWILTGVAVLALVVYLAATTVLDRRDALRKELLAV